jgi:hypothetical protein
MITAKQFAPISMVSITPLITAYITKPPIKPPYSSIDNSCSERTM